MKFLTQTEVDNHLTTNNAETYELYILHCSCIAGRRDDLSISETV
jgi:hypothetical protein